MFEARVEKMEISGISHNNHAQNWDVVVVGTEADPGLADGGWGARISFYFFC